MKIEDRKVMHQRASSVSGSSFASVGSRRTVSRAVGLDSETAEHRRLRESRERKADWKEWGPYVSDRAWGTGEFVQFSRSFWLDYTSTATCSQRRLQRKW